MPWGAVKTVWKSDRYKKATLAQCLKTRISPQEKLDRIRAIC